MINYLIQVGMAANLKDYVLTNCDGQEVLYGMPLDYTEKNICNIIHFLSLHFFFPDMQLCFCTFFMW